MIIINWFFAFIVTIVPFFIEGSYGLEKESRGCVISSKVFAGAFTAGVTVSLIPLNIVTIVYGIILHRVRQSGKRAATTARSVIRNVSIANMKRQAKIMHQMSINSSILAAGGFPMFFLIIWYKIEKQPAPEPSYVLGFNSITICVLLMTIAQFIMNAKVKSVAVKYIHPRQLPNIKNTISQSANLPTRESRIVHDIESIICVGN
jgi:hypothetical protein